MHRVHVPFSMKKGTSVKYSVLLLMCLALTTVADENDWLMESLRPAIVALNTELAEEYELLLVENPEAAGTITLDFRIMPDGAIWDLSVTADSLLQPLIPLIDSLFDGSFIELSQPIQASIPIVVPIELKPGEM